MNYITEEIIYIYNIYGSGEWPAKILKEAHNACKSSFHWHGFVVYYSKYYHQGISTTEYKVRPISQYNKKCEANIILSNPPHLVKLYKKVCLIIRSQECCAYQIRSCGKLFKMKWKNPIMKLQRLLGSGLGDQKRKIYLRNHQRHYTIYNISYASIYKIKCRHLRV